MEKAATDYDILNYDEYHKFKKRFSNEYTPYDELNREQFLNSTNFNIKNGLSIRPVFEKLLKLIRNRTIFIDNQHKACSYISYIFSNEVQNNAPEYEPETFEMFKNFVHKYNTQRITSNVCPNNLLYVNSEIYKKMNKLYAMYEEYDNHENTYKLLGEPENCPALESFLNNYNYFIRTYQPNNTYYENILKHFEKKIKQREALYKEYACRGKNFNIQKIILPILPKPENPEASVQIEQQNIHTGYQVPQEKSPSSVPEVRAPHAEPEISHIQPQRSHVRPQISHEKSQPPHKETQLFQETPSLPAQPVLQQEAQGLLHNEISERELKKHLSQVYPPHGSFEPSQTSLHSEHYTYPPVSLSTNEVEMPPPSVMSTITSALKDVDPVPVVGVSGGMGVLFLLFRYTPVGTFFRGRGYRQRIPTRFDGAYPGFFPGFQGFEEWYFPNDQINIAYGRE